MDFKEKYRRENVYRFLSNDCSRHLSGEYGYCKPAYRRTLYSTGPQSLLTYGNYYIFKKPIFGQEKIFWLIRTRLLRVPLLLSFTWYGKYAHPSLLVIPRIYGCPHNFLIESGQGQRTWWYSVPMPCRRSDTKAWQATSQAEYAGGNLAFTA